MAQFGRPRLDAIGGNYVNQAGSAASLWQSIDEVSPIDTDYIHSISWATSADEYQANLTVLTDPVSSVGHIIRFRYAVAVYDGTSWSFTVSLYQGPVTVIASAPLETGGATTGIIQNSYTLTAAEADSITNYPDLRLDLRFDDTGFNALNVDGIVYWCELEVPDAPSLSSSIMGQVSL